MKIMNIQATEDYKLLVDFEDKAVYWEPTDGEMEIVPVRFTLDDILFSLR